MFSLSLVTCMAVAGRLHFFTLIIISNVYYYLVDGLMILLDGHQLYSADM
jgi:hypothetical protein